MTEEKFLKVICVSLKTLAWILLIFGILFSAAVSVAIMPVAFLTRWSGAVVLFFFILVFLVINLLIKIAQMSWEIKKKACA
jgi:membrane protein YdbS with pleckstrin-like domain